MVACMPTQNASLVAVHSMYSEYSTSAPDAAGSGVWRVMATAISPTAKAGDAGESTTMLTTATSNVVSVVITRANFEDNFMVRAPSRTRWRRSPAN